MTDHEIEAAEAAEIARQRYANSTRARPVTKIPAVPPIIIPAFADEAARQEWRLPLPPSIPTGLADLDKAIGGLHAEGAYALVGPTGRGKTGLALQISRAVARHQTVLYLSSELSRRQVLSRAAAPLLRRPWKALYQLPPDQGHVVADALSGVRLRIQEVTRNLSLFELIADVSAVDGRAPVIVIDYLQHAARRLVPDDLRLATAALMDQVTDWARAQHSIALVLSSTARSFHGDNEGRTATDFVVAGKETGEVEYDAAGVFFLDCDVCPTGGTAAARLHIAKSRFEGTGMTVGLRFDGAYGEFTCDPSAALSADHLRIIEAIEAGNDTLDTLRKAVGMAKASVVSATRYLQRIRVIDCAPYRVIPRVGKERETNATP